jgi:hypothetical protein
MLDSVRPRCPRRIVGSSGRRGKEHLTGSGTAGEGADFGTFRRSPNCPPGVAFAGVHADN